MGTVYVPARAKFHDNITKQSMLCLSIRTCLEYSDVDRLAVPVFIIFYKHFYGNSCFQTAFDLFSIHIAGFRTLFAAGQGDSCCGALREGSQT